VLNDCATCHLPDTHQLPITASLLPTTNLTTDGVNAAPADVDAARATVPNATDRVTSPTAAACGMCHDSAAVAAHMQQNGAAVDWERWMYESQQPVETCEVCHDTGSIADVNLVHGLLE
jgi:OmcA/MtrC family decaheme c-type cytochrome